MLPTNLRMKSRNSSGKTLLLSTSGKLMLKISALTLATLLYFIPYADAASARFLVYVGTYTGPQSKGIYVYRFDSATGKLDSGSLAAELNRPSFVAIHPNRKYLYAVSELGSSTVS